MNDELLRRRGAVVRATVCVATGVLVLAGWAAPGASAAARFAPARSLATAASPGSVAAADFNGDGKADLVAVTAAGASVLLGHGDGTFGNHTDFSAGTKPNDVATPDINGDGRPDLAVSDGGAQPADPGVVSVLLNTTSSGATTPSFTSPTAVATGSNGPIGITAADLNGDHKPDLAVTQQSSLAGLINQTAAGASTPSFATAVNTNVPPGASPTTADFNGDGKADVAFAVGGDQSIFVFHGNGAGGFPSSSTAGTGGLPASVDVSDFNGDGKPDLVAANPANTGFNRPDSVSLNLNTTTSGATSSTFAKSANFAADKTPVAVAAADLNGDGKSDVAAVNPGSNDVSVLLGDGAGSLSAAANFSTGSQPVGVVAADFNGDGALDLAVTDAGSSDISVLMNVPSAEPSPGALTFGSASRPVTPGTITPAQTLSITNTGSAPLTVSGFGLSGPAAADFLTANDTCRTPVPPGGSCTVEVRFAPVAAGTRSATLTPTTNAPTQASVTLTGTAAIPSPPSAAPKLSALILRPSTFAALGSGGTIARVSRGTRVSYRDSEKATTTFVIARQTAGVRSGGKCKRASGHAGRHAKRCVLFVKVGSFTHNDKVGTNSFRFTGRLRHHKLQPGTYRITAVPRNGTGKRGSPRTKSFRIVRG